LIGDVEGVLRGEVHRRKDLGLNTIGTVEGAVMMLSGERWVDFRSSDDFRGSDDFMDIFIVGALQSV
jgi:hypothetical protein